VLSIVCQRKYEEIKEEGQLTGSTSSYNEDFFTYIIGCCRMLKSMHSFSFENILVKTPHQFIPNNRTLIVEESLTIPGIVGVNGTPLNNPIAKTTCLGFTTLSSFPPRVTLTSQILAFSSQ
jgi:hypothetical protein